MTYKLVKALAGYEDAVMSAAEKNEPSVVARYVISLATEFTSFIMIALFCRQKRRRKRHVWF